MNLTTIPGEKTGENLGLLSNGAVAAARRFHASFPQYRETPLVELKNLADACGIRDIFVKDESLRFGLNAFKVLGGSYAIGRYLAERVGLDVSELSYETLTSTAFHKACGDITFVTATDGNHGRGVAWTARELGQKAVVYMPEGSSAERLENIRAEGAEASVTDMNYDDTVRMADQTAKKNGWVLVQDTAWPGYESIPGWIITGYGTMASEICDEIPEVPTHVFLQAGVGSMAAAAAAVIRNAFALNPPVITIVEPENADCIYRTAKADDGTRHFVTGKMQTIMAGLACGEPCSIAWEILSHNADFALSCEDFTSANGMRTLGAPLAGDSRVISGESGAAGIGAVLALLRKPEHKNLADVIGLGPDSTILCISTEGATDKARYRDIVWDGAFSAGGLNRYD